jgi:hypothetical protein
MLNLDTIPQRIKSVVEGTAVYGGAGVSVAGWMKFLSVVQPMVAVASGVLASTVAICTLYKMWKNRDKK